MIAAPVYMDYNATAPVRPAVIAAMAEALAATGNPSSVHRFGRAARRRVEEAREQVAALIGAQASMVTFTSGGTEANILALAGVPGGRRLLVSAIEHDSVLKTAGANGAEVIPVTADGQVDVDALAAMLAADGRPALISVMLANNETGVLQPLDRIADLARTNNAVLHCDIIQAAGKIPLDIKQLGADLVTLSAHKIGGPQGVGAVVTVNDALDLDPLLKGGGQEMGKRAGTENVAGIAGFGLAAEISRGELEAGRHLAGLRDALERRARAMAPRAVLFGAAAPRLPNTSCIALPGVAAQTQVMSLDLAGVAVSAGSACSSGKVKASHVLQAMGAPPDLAGSAIRVSLGWASRAEDVDRFLDAWRGLGRRAGLIEDTAAA